VNIPSLQVQELRAAAPHGIRLKFIAALYEGRIAGCGFTRFLRLMDGMKLRSVR
jgi:hypothetical protein